MVEGLIAQPSSHVRIVDLWSLCGFRNRFCFRVGSVGASTTQADTCSEVSSEHDYDYRDDHQRRYHHHVMVFPETSMEHERRSNAAAAPPHLAPPPIATLSAASAVMPEPTKALPISPGKALFQRAFVDTPRSTAVSANDAVAAAFAGAPSARHPISPRAHSKLGSAVNLPNARSAVVRDERFDSPRKSAPKGPPGIC